MAVSEVAGRGRNAGAIKKTVTALTAAFGSLRAHPPKVPLRTSARRNRLCPR